VTIKLLCVDDDPLISKSLGAVLQCTLKGWDITMLTDPLKALDHLQQTPDWQPDVVISDMMMPGMNGLEFLTAVKGMYPQASLLMLTGYADKQSAITAINQLGLFYYLEKPWNVDNLPVILKKAAEHCELKHNLSTTQQALDHAATSHRLREDFVATLTHDLRTPLQASQQTLGMLYNQSLGPLTEKQAQVVHMLQHNQQDVLKLVNTLLLVYRFESGQNPLAKQPVVLNTWLPTVLGPLQALAAGKQHTLTVQGPAQPVTVYADAFALQRVINNLVSNAIHYTPNGGHIGIGLDLLVDNVIITVKDNGRGIPAEDIPHLFQRFSQGSSRVRHSGSGLGLYLSRQITEAHGGTIAVKSQEGEGSVFTVALPMALPGDIPVTARQATPAATTPVA
jgi:two-component system, sensor histidine kinase and response regulator